MIQFKDKIINCCDCKEDFEFSAGEQKFFAEREFQTPKRCKSCKQKKRMREADDFNNRGY